MKDPTALFVRVGKFPGVVVWPGLITDLIMLQNADTPFTIAVVKMLVADLTAVHLEYFSPWATKTLITANQWLNTPLIGL